MEYVFLYKLSTYWGPIYIELLYTIISKYHSIFFYTLTATFETSTKQYGMEGGNNTEDSQSLREAVVSIGERPKLR